MSFISILPLLANTGAEISRDLPSLGVTLLYLLGIALFLLMNAFFVASEFAIVKVRASQLETEGKDKPKRSAIAKDVIRHLDGYLSATQLGITIASLALGYLGEPFVQALVAPILLKIPHFPEQAIAPISIGLAIASFTFLHVVIGELLPKSLAIRLALPVTLAVVRPLHWFYMVFRLLIGLLNGTANWLLKHLFRVDPVSGSEHAHSAEEIALLVTESEKSKEVTETEREILINALELNDLSVRDVMTPRNEVVVLDADDPFEKSLEIARDATHTRFPLVKGHLDNAIGLVHVKDMVHLMMGDDHPDLTRIKRELKVVPDTMPLDTLLQFFLKEHAHLALAVDEFGHPAGVVFLDNVIEEIVGDIQDEFDDEPSEFTRINADEFVVEGSLTLNELSDHEPALDLDSGEVTTVGGYVIQQLGRFPKVGETLEIMGHEARVTSASERKVGQVHFRKLARKEG